MDSIAVIILNYKTWQETLREVDIIKSLNNGQALDVVVVDNASPNDSYSILEKNADGRYILLHSKENRGYAAGNNIGLKYCYLKGYKYALILNNDILIHDSFILDKLTDILNRDKSLAVVNPDVYSPDGHLYNRDSKRPTFFDLTLGMFAYKKKGREICDLGGYGYVYRPQGCCMLVDLSKMAEVGYFDEATFLYTEELILAERFLSKGYRCACCTESSVIHNHAQTVGRSFNKKNINKIKLSSFRHYLKNYRHFSWLSVKVCLMFYKFKLLILQ